jgi:hypothetical protein
VGGRTDALLANRFRYEHRADIHRAFLQLCCDLISSRFPRLTTSNPRERSAWTAAHGICYTRDMTIKRLDHVSVVVDDLAAAVAFFTALGMTLEGEMPRNSSEAFTAFGDTAGALSATARATRPSPTAT